MNLAPIALFVFRRYDHTMRTLEALKKNDLAKESSLYVFSDGARQDKDVEGIEKTRALFKDLGGFKEVHVIEREVNFGLAKNIIDGVGQLVDSYGRVIVLEDDLATSPYFLRFMNEALDTYEDEERVCSVHGYIYPVRGKLPNTFFMRGADCWGWATWARAWQHFEPNGETLLAQLEAQKLNYAFDLDGLVPYTQMLKDQIAGKNNSWAIRWHAATFLGNQLTLYPGMSLINNIGNDASGQHCVETDVFSTQVSQLPIAVDAINVTENLIAREVVKDYFRSIKPSFLTRIVSKIRREMMTLKHGT